MPTQLSNCCKAVIDFNPKLDRPECYTCIECGRVIGTPLETTHPSVEEAVEEFKKKQELIEPDGFLADVGEDYEAVDFNMETMEDWLTKTLTTLREDAVREERERCTDIIANQCRFTMENSKPQELRNYASSLANRLYSLITTPPEAITNNDIEPYYQHDHRHCPSTNSPCGIEGKHRCCLCSKPVDV